MSGLADYPAVLAVLKEHDIALKALEEIAAGTLRPAHVVAATALEHIAVIRREFDE